MHEKLQKAITKLVFTFDFLAIYPLSWDIIETNGVRTMAVDYKRLYYNREFVEELTIGEIVAVLIHEVFHCVLLHPSSVDRKLSEGKVASVWRHTLEQVTNNEVLNVLENTKDYKLPGTPVSPIDILKRQAVAVERGYIYDPDLKDMDEIEIYQKLVKHYDPTIDDDPDLDPSLDEVLPADDNAEVKQEAIEKAIATIEKMKKKLGGKLSGNLERLLRRLTKPQVPWKRILYNFVSKVTEGHDEYSFSKPNVKHPLVLSGEVIVPATQSKIIENGVIVVDTSGSISIKELIQFASEIAEALKQMESTTVITTDVEVKERVKVSSIGDLLGKLKFKGGGGTDFNNVFNQVKSCEFMIFFTDGYAEYPKKPPQYPVLWVLTKDNTKPPWGTVAYMLEEN